MSTPAVRLVSMPGTATPALSSADTARPRYRWKRYQTSARGHVPHHRNWCVQCPSAPGAPARCFQSSVSLGAGSNARSLLDAVTSSMSLGAGCARASLGVTDSMGEVGSSTLLSRRCSTGVNAPPTPRVADSNGPSAPAAATAEEVRAPGLIVDGGGAAAQPLETEVGSRAKTEVDRITSRAPAAHGLSI